MRSALIKCNVADIFNSKQRRGFKNKSDDYDSEEEDNSGKSSNGQKQLFGFCRMLLRKHKILILDEATTDVDLQTDEQIQKLTRGEFKECTVLTIAHRLDTIKNSDRIIVMDHGKIVEVGPPKELMEKGVFFAKLVESSEY
ncbi:ATP-binding cassette sub- C member 8 [Coemansia sp. RSA 1722]|nr:ATP-binding cassette sub- C member 8 [Coemansia sp. RSA 1722]